MTSLSLLLFLSLAPPDVQIDEPLAGWTTERLATVRGKVKHSAPMGMLNVNGVERPLAFVAGGFEATFPLARGENAIEVVAPGEDGAAPARARLNLYAQIPRVDLQVILFWDTDKTDVDLHIKEPSGEVVNYTHLESQAGGRLDRDDTDGFGPEIYSLGSAIAGEYEVIAHYFGDRGTGQTTANVVVVAREGTEEERRWRFEVPLIRAGEKASLGRFYLPAPGLRMESGPKLGVPVHEKDAPLPHAGDRRGD